MAKRTQRKVKNLSKFLKGKTLPTRKRPSWNIIVSFWNDTEQVIFDVYEVLNSWNDVITHVKKQVNNTKFISKISLARHNSEDGFKMPTWFKHITLYKVFQFPQIFTDEVKWLEYVEGVYDGKMLNNPSLYMKKKLDTWFKSPVSSRELERRGHMIISH